jgi:large subunit ribosomal protein L17
MRHGVKGRKLGRTTSHREALFRNQLQSLMDKERIVTTLPKAKELRPLAERVITRGKQGTVHARRWALRWLLRRDLVKKVFDDIAPRFRERPGGYLRIVKLGPRQGDGAEMAVIEMVDRVAPAGTEKSGSGKEAAGGGKRGAGGKSAAKPAKRGAAGKTAAKPEKAAKGEEAAEKPEKAAKSAKKQPAKPPARAKAEGGKGTSGKKEPREPHHPKGEVKRSTSQRTGGRKPTTPQKTG